MCRHTYIHTKLLCPALGRIRIVAESCALVAWNGSPRCMHGALMCPRDRRHGTETGDTGHVWQTKHAHRNDEIKKEFMPIITVTSAPRSSLSWWCCWVNRLGGKAVYTSIQVCRVCMWPSVVVKFKVEPTLCVSPCLWQHKNNDASDKI